MSMKHDMTPTPYEQGYERGYNKGYADGQPKWISVKDRTPEPGITKMLVFVRHEHGNIVDTARYLGAEGWDLTSWKLWDNCVTHWMSLPEPPKEGENK